LNQIAHTNPSLSPKMDDDPYNASPLRVLGRILVWIWALGGFAFQMVLDRLAKKGSASRDANNLRRTLERLGPSAIKIGQQLSVRTDLIPKEYSDALMGLLDAVPPFSAAVARRQVERELGRTIEDAFQFFDFEPIGSASIACVYKARLHTGQFVAVKVRRPEVRDVLVSDLAAVSWLGRIFELVGLADRGRSRPVIDEFRRMLLDELNFRIEARQTDLFRSYGAKRNRYVTAPRVYREYSTSAVLVTEFIEGIFLRQILAAIQNEDQPFLDWLAARGYSLAAIAGRLLNIFYWQLFENIFFHADPHPSNVILQPDKIVLIDFGATGTITQKYRRDLLRFVRCLADDNIDGMVRNMIASLEPLPPLNMENYTNEMYNAMREYLFTARSEHSTWQEKSSGRAMMAIAEISRKYKIPMRADVLRYMRASFQFDSIVYRLYPEVDSRREFQRYFRQRAKRLAKDNAKSWKKTRQIGIRSSLGIAIGELRERLGDVDTVISFVAKHTTQLEQLFQRRVTAIARTLGWGLAALRLAGSISLVLVLWTWFRQHHPGSAVCGAMNSAFGFAFGLEAARFVDFFPMLSERLWFWITGGLLITLFSLEALIGRLLTPRSKLE